MAQSGTAQEFEFDKAGSPDAGRPAGFGVRFVALLIDQFVLGIAGAIAGGVVGGIAAAGATSPEAALAASSMAGLVVGLVISTAYYILLTGTSGATLGKKALGLVIVRTDGRPLGFGGAIVRFLCFGLSSLTLGIGFLIAAFRADKRALHDLLAETKVIHTR